MSHKQVIHEARKTGGAFTVDAEAPRNLVRHMADRALEQMESLAQAEGRFIDRESVKFIEPETVTWHTKATWQEHAAHLLRHMRPHPGHTTVLHNHRISATAWPNQLKGYKLPTDRTSLKLYVIEGPTP